MQVADSNPLYTFDLYKFAIFFYKFVGLFFIISVQIRFKAPVNIISKIKLCKIIKYAL
jgi:hypothetical protein